MPGKVVGAEVGRAGTQHLMLTLELAQQRYTHVRADCVEGHDVLVGADATAGRLAQLDQVIDAVEVIPRVIE